jgi:WD40 repeat protein/DNA-binding SARP family transcriptional activator
MLEVRVLGQFELRLDREALLLPSRPAQSLLAYLVLSAGTAHRREKLAGLLWPDADDDNARKSLRHALWRIRKLIESDRVTAPYLLSDELAVSFNAGADYLLDAAVLVRDGDSLHEQLAAVWAYQGELLPGFYDDWVTLERERLESLFQLKMQRLLDRLVEERRWSQVLEWGERWVALGHAPEPGYRALMLAHAELGDRPRVAQVFRRCREALFNELGVAPSLPTRRLYERLCRDGDEGEPAAAQSLAAAVLDETPAPGVPPYQGLLHFDEQDSDRFFGRERLTTLLVERLRTEPFVAVIGASGSGKSSLVRAGLVPALKRMGLSTGGPWDTADGRFGNVGQATVCILTPTAHPLEALANSLRSSAVREHPADGRMLLEDLGRDPRGLRRVIERQKQVVVLVVDQFEELYTLCRDSFEREAFTENLLTAVEMEGLAHVVIALRADFYAHCAEYPSLREALARHQEYVGPLSVADLRKAIEEPARQSAWELEPGLIELLLRDVGDEPGALPLLSHALLETWRRRRGRRLTLAGYTAAGGVQGAIAQTAETVFTKQLDRPQQAIARRLLLHLTELGEGTQDTRRRVKLRDLNRHPNEEIPVRSVLAVLADARLVTVGEDSVEVAHEALIREWPRLREWLNQDRMSLRLHRQLTQSARDWEGNGYDVGMAFRGARLAQAVEWAADHDSELSDLERTFLDASRELAQREASEQEAQRQRELEAARRLAATERRASSQLRQRALLLTVAFVITLATSGVAAFLGDQARRNAALAETNARTAFARELASSAAANLDIDPERSILLALQAIATTASNAIPEPEAENALHRSVEASRTRLTIRGHSDRVQGLAFSPDGRHLVTTSADRTARVWDTFTGVQALVLAGHTDEVDIPAYSPDGTLIATPSWDQTTRIWDAASGSQLRILEGHTDQVRAAVFSPDGTHLVTASSDATARIWDVATGRQLGTPLKHADGLLGVAYSPDGTRIATASRDRTAAVWDAASGQRLATLSGHESEVISVAFSPDGLTIATGGADATLRLWDATTGVQTKLVSLASGPVESVVFSPDGSRLAGADYSGIGVVWDTSNWKELFRLRGHSSWITQIAFSPDGTRLSTASADYTARIWDASPGNGELFTLQGHAGIVWDVEYSPDGARILTGGFDNTARVWDATNGFAELSLVGHADRVYGVNWSPDGKSVVTASGDNTARIWDAVDGRLRFVLSGHEQPLIAPAFFGAARVVGVQDVTYSPDGKLVATAGVDGTARLWDAASGQSLRVLRGHKTRVNSVMFSPDGMQLATASDDFTAKIWDVSTGNEIRALAGHALRVYRAVYSLDGKRLATSSADGTTVVWDVLAGQPVLTLRGQSGVIKVSYSHDGTRLATAATDGSVRIWDASSGRELLALDAPGAGAARASFSPDDSKLVVGRNDGVAGVYLLKVDDLVGLARARTSRSLTPDECRRLLHVDGCP